MDLGGFDEELISRGLPPGKIYLCGIYKKVVRRLRTQGRYRYTCQWRPGVMKRPIVMNFEASV